MHIFAAQKFHFHVFSTFLWIGLRLSLSLSLSLSLFSFKLKFFFEKVKLGLTFLEFMRRGDPYFIIFPLPGMKWSKWNNFSLEIKNFLSNGPTTASFCFFCRSFQTHKLYRNNCRLQRDSNSDHWNTLTTWLPPQPTKLSFAMNANYLNPFFLKHLPSIIV